MSDGRFFRFLRQMHGRIDLWMRPTIRREGPILPRAVRRDVVILIGIKLIALFAIYQVFFKPNEHAPFHPAEVAQHIFGPSDAH